MRLPSIKRLRGSDRIFQFVLMVRHGFIAWCVLVVMSPNAFCEANEKKLEATYVAKTRTLEVSLHGVPRYRYTFNKGGAINGIYDLKIAPGSNLVGESFQGETTDRVIQWTYWNARYEGKPHTLGDGDVRANVTMEGCFHEAATCEVLRTPDSSEDIRELVFESRIEHWFYKILDRHGRPKFETRSHYNILADGNLLLTRSVVRYPWDLTDVIVKTKLEKGGWERKQVAKVRMEAINLGRGTTTSYLEGWTPLRRTVLPNQSHGRGAFDGDGYKQWQPEDLGGWAMAHSEKLAVGVVFGAKQVPENRHRTQLTFNKLDLPQHRLNVLMPAVETNWPDGARLTQTLAFVVGNPDDVKERARKLIKEIPVPVIENLGK